MIWLKFRVSKELYYICEKNRFYVKKFQESKRTFEDRDWILSHYKELFDGFILICLGN